MRKIITSILVATIMGGGAAIGVGVNAANAAPQSGRPVCADTRLLAIHYAVKGRPTMFGWSVRHRTRPWVIVADTILCDGGYDQQGFIAYVDTGDWHAPLPAGTELWSFPILDNAGPHT